MFHAILKQLKRLITTHPEKKSGDGQDPSKKKDPVPSSDLDETTAAETVAIWNLLNPP